MVLLRGGQTTPAVRHDRSAWSMLDRRNRLVPGTPLPCCALVQVRGDWEWMVHGVQVPQCGKGPI